MSISDGVVTIHYEGGSNAQGIGEAADRVIGVVILHALLIPTVLFFQALR